MTNQITYLVKTTKEYWETEQMVKITPQGCLIVDDSSINTQNINNSDDYINLVEVFVKQGYTEATREDFDAIYKKAVEKVNNLSKI